VSNKLEKTISTLKNQINDLKKINENNSKRISEIELEIKKIDEVKKPKNKILGKFLLIIIMLVFSISSFLTFIFMDNIVDNIKSWGFNDFWFFILSLFYYSILSFVVVLILWGVDRVEINLEKEEGDEKESKSSFSFLDLFLIVVSLVFFVSVIVNYIYPFYIYNQKFIEDKKQPERCIQKNDSCENNNDAQEQIKTPQNEEQKTPKTYDRETMGLGLNGY